MKTILPCFVHHQRCVQKVIERSPPGAAGGLCIRISRRLPLCISLPTPHTPHLTPRSNRQLPVAGGDGPPFSGAAVDDPRDVFVQRFLGSERPWKRNLDLAEVKVVVPIRL